MPQPETEKAIKTMLEAIFFENWLRYHFLMENEDQTICLRIPEAAWQKIKTQTPELEAIARELDEKPVDFESSRSTLLKFLRDWCKAKGIPEDDCLKIVLAPEFQEELENQQNWLSLQQLSLPDLGFRDWQKLYRNWKLNNRLAEKEIFPASRK